MGRLRKQITAKRSTDGTLILLQILRTRLRTFYIGTPQYTSSLHHELDVFDDLTVKSLYLRYK